MYGAMPLQTLKVRHSSNNGTWFKSVWALYCKLHVIILIIKHKHSIFKNKFCTISVFVKYLLKPISVALFIDEKKSYKYLQNSKMLTRS